MATGLSLNVKYFAVVDSNGDFLVMQKSPGVYTSQRAAENAREKIIKWRQHCVDLFRDSEFLAPYNEELEHAKNSVVKQLRIVLD